MEQKPKNEKTMKRIKIVYAAAVILALGGAVFAKYSTEKALSGVLPQGVSESKAELSLGQSERTSNIFEERVGRDVTNVRDTRSETKIETEKTTEEKTTEKNKFAVPYKDKYELPAGAEVIKSFSDSKPVYSKTMGDWRVHNAVDFAGEEVAQIKAIAFGTVTDVKTDALFGVIVTVDHGNGVTARYCGLSKDADVVKVGAEVEAGETLGYLGDIPCEKADGAHLHLEIECDGKAADPLKVMNR